MLRNMAVVVDGKLYRTEGATLLATDTLNTWLFKSPKGAYFVQTQRQDESDSIRPVGEDEAISLWGSLGLQQATFEEAFPGASIEEA